MRRLEREIHKIDDRIAQVKVTMGTLKEERDGRLAQFLAAARDEGELPLFDFDEE